MAERTLTISSLGKTFSVTGWKVGWATRPGAAGRRRARGQAVPDVRGRDAVPARGRRRAAARRRLVRGVRGRARGQARPHLRRARRRGLRRRSVPQGTYFVNADVGTDAAEFARELPHQAGVVAIPTSVFSTDPARLKPYLRFAFCKRLGVIDEAAQPARPLERPARELEDPLDLVALERRAGRPRRRRPRACAPTARDRASSRRAAPAPAAPRPPRGRPRSARAAAAARPPAASARAATCPGPPARPPDRR